MISAMHASRKDPSAAAFSLATSFFAGAAGDAAAGGGGGGGGVAAGEGREGAAAGAAGSPRAEKSYLFLASAGLCMSVCVHI